MPHCRCGRLIQSGQQCKRCRLADRYSTGSVGASAPSGRTVVADEAGPSPSATCGECGASYQGLPAARQCCTDGATGQQPRVATDGGEYVRETGEGYQGIYSVSNNTVSIPLTSHPVDWAAGDVIWAVDAPADGGVVLTDAEPADPLGRYEVIAERASLTERDVATTVSVHPSGIDPLDIEAGDSVRVYEHDDGLLLVDPDDDPRVDGGDGA